MIQPSRLEPFLKGVKAGSAKRTLDLITNRISDPVADLVIERLQDEFPNLSVASPTVRALMHSALLLGLAELLSVTKPFIPHEPKRIQDLEVFVRTYAGERTGTEAVDLLTRMIPLILQSFSDVDLQECAETGLEFLDSDAEAEAVPIPLLAEQVA